MRIISGKAKGRKLKVPKTDKVRPTQDKVKEALFNIIHIKEGDKVLDLYAGAGSIGIEALSRGAKEVVFIDQKPRLVHENVELSGLGGARIYGTKVAIALKVLSKHKEQFDLIFLDPPYAGDEVLITLKNISSFDILNPHGIVIAEHNWQQELPAEINGLIRYDQRQYGQAILSFYKRGAE